ncbi:MAG: ABC transporter ATP-binding protein, partial [Oscillospiraceae bacterium]|nr:ABC transporter ATP-binding protein [Oscillospiraceae bacterium]
MIKLENVTLRFKDTCILKDFNLCIEDGEHIVIMGASGSGKTTLLKLISNQLKPTSGTVQTTAKRISYMFQEHRLLPWLTAAENVNLVLGDKKESLPEAVKWLEQLGLTDAANRYPAQLSGGMRQRVALARALAFNGDLLLLDEPLASLDEESATEIL